MTHVSLLNAIIAEESPSYPKKMGADKIFEFYCMKNILSNFDLSTDEIQQGIVDGQGDGGIDGVYIFVDGNLLTDDTDYAQVRHKPELQLFIVQAKNETSFKESAVDAISASLPILLDHQKNRKNLKKIFKIDLVELCRDFIDCHLKLASKFPIVSIRIAYCCKGERASTALCAKRDKLKANLELSYEKVDFSLFGAQELYKRSGIQKTLFKVLPCKVTPLSGTNYYVALVDLNEYAKFITGEDGNIVSRIFEANVRAYQGSNDVNKEIAESLKSPKDGVDFWWLNNGITMLVDDVKHTGAGLNIENPLIVNGLQTSYEIHAQSIASGLKKGSSVLIRVIKETDPDKRDLISKATNRQTSIEHPSFLANDPIQSDIQKLLELHGFYYDRRRNEQRQRQRPSDKILSIGRLTQAILAFVLQEPHTARGRPGAALKDDRKSKIFCDNQNVQPLDIYLVAAKLQEAIDAFFKKIAKTEERTYRNNLKYHVLMVLSWELIGQKDLNPIALSKMKIPHNVDDKINLVFTWVKSQFINAGAEDGTAKDTEFTETLRSKWKPKLFNAKNNQKK